jgi:WD40 repeat protein
MTTLEVPGRALQANPFVGPRALQPGELIYGREREIRRLTNLLVAERIVLLYSPSGAGKTSLIQAGLAPKLHGRRFRVSPMIRVSHRLPEQLADQNRYLVSTLQSLEARLDPRDQRPPQDLVGMGLEAYLTEWAAQQESPDRDELMIFDQFEEVLVLDSGDDEAKREFFRELGAALENRGRWALFSMREDYIAGLDPYVAELPTRLHSRMRLDLLTPETARRAIESPAAAAGRPFQEAASGQLVGNLRQMRAERGGVIVPVAGPFVEPLQLQVVCHRLWNSLPPDATEITSTDVERLGGIRDALSDYYATEVARVARDSGVPERAIRDWFTEHLITEQGVRRQHQGGPGSGGPASDDAVRLLEDTHLVRGESRRGTRWLELAHDQLVEPVLTNNTQWRDQHLSPVQRQAQEWAAHERTPDLLLTGQILTRAQAWATENDAELTELDHQFLAASAEAESDKRRRRRHTVLLRWLCSALVVVLVFALWQWRAAVSARAAAASRADAALASAQLQRDPVDAVRLAERALTRAVTPQAEDALRLAMSQNLPYAVLIHDNNVTSLQFNPQADQLLTSSYDGTVRIWDSATGAESRRLQHREGVRTASFSPDGQKILTMTDNGQLSVWLPQDKDEPSVQVDGLDLPVQFNHDGSRVAAVQRGTNTVLVLDSTSGREAVPTLRGHQDKINSVSFSPDDGFVVTASLDGSARVWDAATGHEVAALRGHSRGAVSALFRPDSRAIASGDGQGTVRLWQWPYSGSPVQVPGQEHGGAFLDFGPPGQLLAWGDESPRLLDSTTGETIRTFDGHRSWLLDARVSAEGRRAVTASQDGTARVWDIPSGQQLAELTGSDGNVWDAGLNRSGSVVATLSDETVRLYRLPQQQFLGTGFTDWALDAQFLPGDALVAAAGYDGRVVVCEVASGRVVQEVKASSTAGVNHIDVHPTGPYIAITVSDGNILVWDWKRNEIVARKQPTTSAITATFDPTGDQLLIGGEGVRTWNWQRPEEPELVISDTYVSRATFIHAGRSIVAANDKVLQMWPLPKAEYRDRDLYGHTGSITDIATSKDGRYLASSSLDGTVRLWNADNGTLLSTMSGLQGGVYSVAFDEQGTRLAAGDDRGFVGVWEIPSGKRLAMLPQHADTVNRVQFSSGVHPSILSASDDTTVRIFDCQICLPLNELRTAAQQLLAGDDARIGKPPVVGDCYLNFSVSRQPVDCEQPHQDEVLTVVTHPGDEDTPFPGSMDDWAGETCRGEAYTDYRGIDYADDTDFYVWWVGPTDSAEWDLGQRKMTCLLRPVTPEQTRGSARRPG